MHFCVSDRASEWLSQIVLDKVHWRWEIEACRPSGGDPPAQTCSFWPLDDRGEIRQHRLAASGRLTGGDRDTENATPMLEGRDSTYLCQVRSAGTVCRRHHRNRLRSEQPASEQLESHRLSDAWHFGLRTYDAAPRKK